MRDPQATSSQTEAADKFVELLCSGGRRQALELFDREPSLATGTFHAACATGHLEIVESWLSSNPAVAVQAAGPLQWPPIVATCFSTYLKDKDDRADRLVRIAELLLKNGADPNTVNRAEGPREDPWKLSVLYAAAGRANHAGMTGLLLEAGADPNDGESLYHATEFQDLECTRLLLAHGAKIEGSNAVHRKLDYDDLPGLRLMLDAGADPNLKNGGETLLHWAIRRLRRVEFLELLAGRGADLQALNGCGLTPYGLAIHVGNAEAAKWLAARTSVEHLIGPQRLLAACTVGDMAVAREVVTTSPGVVTEIQASGFGFVAELAWNGNREAVRVALEVGFNPNSAGHQGQTPLHKASWMGFAEIVTDLLAAGARVEVVESQYKATPLGWALHGSLNSRDGEGRPLNSKADYPRIVRKLLAAGAKAPAEINLNWSEPIRDILVKHATSA